MRLWDAAVLWAEGSVDWAPFPRNVFIFPCTQDITWLLRNPGAKYTEDTQISLPQRILEYSVDLMHDKHGSRQYTTQDQPMGLNFINSRIVQISSSFVVPYQIRLSLSPWLPAFHGCRETLSQVAFYVCLQDSHPMVLSSFSGSLLCIGVCPYSWLQVTETQLQNVTIKGTLLEDLCDCWRGVAWPRGKLELPGSLFISFSPSISLAPSCSSLYASIVSLSQIPPYVKNWPLVFSMPCTPLFNHQGGPAPLPLILGPKLSGNALHPAI